MVRSVSLPRVNVMETEKDTHMLLCHLQFREEKMEALRGVKCLARGHSPGVTAPESLLTSPSLPTLRCADT